MRPVAIVQHEPSVPPGLISEVLEETNVAHVLVEAWRDVEWPRAADLGGLVVLGGTMNVDELDAYPYLRKSRALMSEAMDAGVPTLGVCLGSQMMARVLGADVYRAHPRNALFSELEPGTDAGDPLIGPFLEGTQVLQFHEDTFSVPAGATPLARSASTGLHQAFRYGDRAYAVQFHFEVDERIVRGWCRNIGEDALASQWGTSERDLVDGAQDLFRAQRAAGRRLVTGFLQLDPAPSLPPVR